MTGIAGSDPHCMQMNANTEDANLLLPAQHRRRRHGLPYKWRRVAHQLGTKWDQRSTMIYSSLNLQFKTVICSKHVTCSPVWTLKHLFHTISSHRELMDIIWHGRLDREKPLPTLRKCQVKLVSLWRRGCRALVEQEGLQGDSFQLIGWFYHVVLCVLKNWVLTKNIIFLEMN